ncbi:hypothetical protein CP978_00565 [Streptomyces nodosus]|uniref:Secreted protein n=2 Tax=Streptomyces TaxID=1883 RepID=A0A0B5DE23_9ACTN|nr:hypothetical protein SNOD_00215 [Streptomyces nodosus]QEV37279.1 hypothetical protein CP978_00565 [Streptomyces nodosus]
MTALVASACLSAATLAATSTTAAAQTDAAECRRLAYGTGTGLSGSMNQCTWDDGRIRVFGTLRDTTPSDGATLFTVRIGLYSRQWLVCASDTPIDTDYQDGGIVGLTYRAVTADHC